MNSIVVLLYGFRVCFLEAYLWFLDRILKVDHSTFIFAIFEVQISDIVVANACGFIVAKIALFVHLAGGCEIYDWEDIFTVWILQESILWELLVLDQVFEDGV